jgi:hydrogenase-4 component B
MSLTLFLVVAAALAQGVGAVLSWAWRRDETRAATASAGAGVAAAVLGVLGSLPVLLGGASATAAVTWARPLASLPLGLRLDPLAALLVLLISLLSGAAAVYGLAYVREYRGRVGRLGTMVGALVAAMLVCVLADDVVTFLLGFESLSLAAWSLITFERDRNAIAAGRVFYATAYAGSVLVVIAFVLLCSGAGSLGFDALRAASPAPGRAAAAFLPAFLGFGARAGMVPFHGWIPREATAAPAHVSALMSGAMVKVGVYGIIRLGADLLHGGAAWWGLVVLAAGAASAVLGVLYALAERDLKRLLASSTTENVGIILMGVGIGMVGLATGRPSLAALGLMAGLYHALNHAMFKGLLFLGAGAVVSRLETRELDRMGGLSRTMPWTALACLVGALAIAAMPPLNGFVSEWFTYQALFDGARGGDGLVRLAFPLGMVMLAMTGALAAMCFCKAYGMTFSGVPRGERAATAAEVERPMLGGMAFLASCCVLLGLGAPLVAPLVRNVGASLTGTAPAVSEGLAVFPGDPTAAVVSPALIAVLLAGLLAVPAAIAGYYASLRPPRKIAREIWAAGYAPDPSMAISSAGFVEPIRVMLRPAFAFHGDPAPPEQSAAGLVYPRGAPMLLPPAGAEPAPVLPAGADGPSSLPSLRRLLLAPLSLFLALAVLLLVFGGR